jgi:hypothetical protein
VSSGLMCVVAGGGVRVQVHAPQTSRDQHRWRQMITVRTTTLKHTHTERDRERERESTGLDNPGCEGTRPPPLTERPPFACACGPLQEDGQVMNGRRNVAALRAVTIMTTIMIDDDDDDDDPAPSPLQEDGQVMNGRRNVAALRAVASRLRIPLAPTTATTVTAAAVTGVTGGGPPAESLDTALQR